MIKQETAQDHFADLMRSKVRSATGGRTGEKITVLTYEQRKAEWEKRFPNREFSDPGFGDDVVEVRIVRDTKCGHRHAINHLVRLREADLFGLGKERFAELVARDLVREFEAGIERHNTIKHQEQA